LSERSNEREIRPPGGQDDSNDGVSENDRVPHFHFCSLVGSCQSFSHKKLIGFSGLIH
jgi:hypothetical protein